MKVATHIRDRLMEAKQHTLRFSPNLQVLAKNLFQRRLFNVAQGSRTIVAFPPKWLGPMVMLLRLSCGLKLHKGASPRMVAIHRSKPARLRVTA
jgi:hypothetical protein